MSPQLRVARVAAVVAAVVASSVIRAEIIYVKSDAMGANSGTSWTDAHTYLQDALDRATGGDEIWVAAGVYRPDQGFGLTPGDRNATFHISGNLLVYGGFAGNETALDERAILFEQTVLSGDLLGDDGPDFANRADNSFHVVTLAYDGQVDGLTIAGGNANGIGGGALAPFGGNGGWLINCILRDNQAVNGGAVASSWTSSVGLIDCLLRDNRATAAGGAVYVSTSQSAISLYNCTLVRNSAPVGATLAAVQDQPLSLSATNCIIQSSSPAISGPEHEIHITYSLVPGPAMWPGEGNTWWPPAMFIDSNANNFRLYSSSGGIDAGNNSAMWLTTDLDGLPRFIDAPTPDTGSGTPPIVDMGAYEYAPPPAFVVGGAPVSVPEGGQAQFTVALSAYPGASLEVNVARTAGDTDISVAAGATLTFDSTNWAVSQPVTLAATEDADFVAGAATIRVSGGTLANALVSATEIENDQGLLANPGAVAVPEGSTASFAVTLASQPAGPVTVSVMHASGDEDLFVLSGATLLFGVSEYATPQSVVIAAALDADPANGEATIRLSAPGILDTYVSAHEVDHLIVFVNAAAPPDGDGTTWATAVRYLQDALVPAASGTDIWVASGLYRPDQGAGQTPGDRLASFILKNGVALYGGFAANEMALYERSLAQESVLSGDLAENDGPAFTNYGENSYHVVVASNANGTAILDGFAVSGGNANGTAYPLDSGGGGFSVAGAAAVRNCTFRANQAKAFGGAWYSEAGSANLNKCVFHGNRTTAPSSEGGAVVAYGGALRDCTFVGNQSPGTAGVAMVIVGGSLTQCLFSGNQGANTVMVFDQSITLQNCTVANNVGTGIRVTGGMFGFAGISNSIVWGNTSQIVVAGQPPWVTAAVEYSDIQGGWSGTGNISAAPQFMNPPGADGILGTPDDDYRLTSGSPGVDAARNGNVPAGVTLDLAGLSRFVDDPNTPDTGSGAPPIVDMGAYEFQVATAVSILTANPPMDNPYVGGQQPFVDVLDTGSGPELTAGIGGTGTMAQGDIAYSPISVTFSAAPSPLPTDDNVVLTCTGEPCPTVTGVSGSGPGPWLITLSAAIPPGECTTLTFAGTQLPGGGPPGSLQYQSQPGNVSLNNVTNTQDLLALVQALNNGAANEPANSARYNINRSTGPDAVNTQDLLRLIQLLNGTLSTQPFNGATVAACP